MKNIKKINDQVSLRCGKNNEGGQIWETTPYSFRFHGPSATYLRFFCAKRSCRWKV